MARLPRETLLDGGAARAVLLSGGGVPDGRVLLCVPLRLEPAATVSRAARLRRREGGRRGHSARGGEVEEERRRGRDEGRARGCTGGRRGELAGDRSAPTPTSPRSEAPVESVSLRSEAEASAVPLRVDQTLAFDAPESSVPSSPGPLSVTPAAEHRDATAWCEASHVEVEPASGAGPPGTLVAAAAAALRAVGCVPLRSPLRLYSSDGRRVLARLHVAPGAPAAVGAGTHFLLRVAENAAGPEEYGSRRAPCPAERAVEALLRQDVQALRALGAAPAMGLLLSGPPGVGKTSGVRAAARACGFGVVEPAPARRGVHGGAAQALRVAFGEARGRAARGERMVVFLDEVDAVCPRRGEGGGEEGRAVAQLLVLMDGADGADRPLDGRLPVLHVVGATNQPGALDPALRRPGRFDREVVLSAPGVDVRAATLLALDSRLDEETATGIAGLTAGYVAADLVQLSDEASRNKLDDADGSEEESEPREGSCRGVEPVAGRLATLKDHYGNALQTVRPSLLRGRLSGEVPRTQWEDIGGLEEVKKRLRMAVEWPLSHPKTFARLGLYSPRGVLLHGPPGCSKTTLVRAMASNGRANFLHLSGADVYSCFVGEAERLVREAFSVARAAAPSILFLDEVDALVGKRGSGGSVSDGGGSQVQSRVLSTLLTEMDGLAGSDGVLVVGATNRVDLIDDALLRPGRFDEIIHVGYLTDADRLAALRVHTRSLPTSPDFDLALAAQWMSGASGAQVAAVCQEAAMHALRKSLVLSECEAAVNPVALRKAPAIAVGMNDIREAIETVL